MALQSGSGPWAPGRFHPDPAQSGSVRGRKEAVLSSQIEGTQSSLQDLLAAEAHILSPERPSDVNEVVNYVRAMN